ncbi:MAG: DUF2087 domain-containing protein [Betaproteobacteria bacterium]|jgi:hypothetical protein
MNPLDAPDAPDRRVNAEKSDTTAPDSTFMRPQLVRLSAMVIKTGLGLGLMSDADRRLALALPAWRLPPGQSLVEAAVNALLKDSLQAEASFLRTDHVELRRWLVDTGWWHRDGFGYAYTRPALDALPEDLRAIAAALSTVDPAAWAQQQVSIHRTAQRERRARWSEAAEVPPAGVSTGSPRAMRAAPDSGAAPAPEGGRDARAPGAALGPG